MDEFKKIISDLDAQYCGFENLLGGLDGWQWEIKTPFYGWTVFDQAAHIVFFDREALLTIEDSSLFRQRSAEVMDIVQNCPHWPKRFNAMLGKTDPPEMLKMWRNCRKKLLSYLAQLSPGDRLSWYGPDMSVRSFITGRLMETWAHSQDVYDALGKQRKNGPELHHIAHLGVTTFAWSFTIHGMTPPKVSPRIELESPSGEIWTWGSPDAEERVKGTALDFCLVVTQRRNVKDTRLQWQGAHVAKWLTIAQAFAGIPQDAPGPGVRVVRYSPNSSWKTSRMDR